MNRPNFYPFHDENAGLFRHCKLALHSGNGYLKDQADARALKAELIVPPEGDCLIFLRGTHENLPNRGIAHELIFSGNGPEGPFKVICPQFRVKSSSEPGENPPWVIASPVNEYTTILYGSNRSIAEVSAVINNFDFSLGNVAGDGSVTADLNQRPILRVVASGRPVEFNWREHHTLLRQLVEAEVLNAAAFATFSFTAWDGASEDELVTFSHDISSLCTYATGQHTGIPVLSFLDSSGRIIKKLIRSPVESKFRMRGILDSAHVPDGLAMLFQQSFDEHVKMSSSRLPWRKLASYCASLEDCSFLEQKFASLVMAIEFFMKNCLLEAVDVLTATQIEDKTLPQLIGMARKYLKWEIPKHYTAHETLRLLRNAVMHGGTLPLKDSAEFRRAFDKWELFLYRRVLMRLGYGGLVVSPHNGYVSSSKANDFSEEHNSFAPSAKPAPRVFPS